jgi:hypothetical protein
MVKGPLWPSSANWMTGGELECGWAAAIRWARSRRDARRRAPESWTARGWARRRMRTEGPVGIRGRDGGVCVAMRMREWDRRGVCRRGRMSAWRGSGDKMSL